MAEKVEMSELAQEYWDNVEKIHKVSGKLLRAKENLDDLNEDDMLFMYNIQLQM